MKNKAKKNLLSKEVELLSMLLNGREIVVVDKSKRRWKLRE